ncbi:phage portal protein family protein [Algivirga pacifica]|uniref:Phage head morphogenesis protein, SPP1 gp7 family n=1 Tax=Algivirga pacifica TaxID=1162670 RepID=A0ABP9D453_9BACT
MKSNKSYHKRSRSRQKGNYKVIAAGGQNGFERKNNKSVLAKLQQGYRDRSRKDIRKWRDALQQAEYPEQSDRTALIHLYEEIKLDTHLHAQLQLRQESTLSRRFYLSRDGQKDEDATKLLQHPVIRKFMKLLLDTLFDGDVVLEIEGIADGMITGIQEIPRENTDCRKKRIYLSEDRRSYIDYSESAYKPWVIEVRSPYGLGLLNKVAPHIIWKRNSLQAWAEYSDIFGIPFRHATTNSKDEKEIDQIEEMLREMGSAAYGVFPLGTEVKIEGGNTPDAYRIFDKMVDRANSEVSKAINSVTMLSDNGSSKSQSEVHERMQGRIMASDGHFVAEIINTQLLPLLVQHGILSEGYTFQWDNTEKLGKDKQWEIVQKLLETHDIPDEWISDTFNIPIEGRKPVNFNKGTEPVASAQSPGIIAMIQKPDYPAPCCGEIEAMQTSRLLKALEKGMIDKVAGGGEAPVWQMGAELARILFEGLQEGWSKRLTAVENVYNAIDHRELTAMEMNIFHFSFAKSNAALMELNNLLVNEDGTIKTLQQFEAEAEHLLEEYNRNWLRTEYNRARAVGQNAAAYHQFFEKEEKEAFPYVQYQTVGDNRVREKHAKLDGMVFLKDDTSWRKFLPPNGWGCRCEIITYLGGTPPKVSKGTDIIRELGSEEYDRLKKGRFDVNYADQQEVFSANERYLKDWDIAKSVKGVDASTLRLKPYADLRKKRKNIPWDTAVTEKNALDLFKEGKDMKEMPFKDYQGRVIKLTKKAFEAHMDPKGKDSKKYFKEPQKRHQLFSLIPEVLSKPDELWVQPYNKGVLFNYRYLKLYQDTVMVVEVKYDEKKGLSIGTWYPAYSQQRSIDKEIRVGIPLLSAKK